MENAQTYLKLKGLEFKARKKKREGKRKGVDMFKHSWLSDRKTSFCDKTGKYQWKILYIIVCSNKFSFAFYNDHNASVLVLLLGESWLVYCEGEGMFCLLCCGYNTKNKYNKQITFNLAPSTNYKHSAVSDHARGSGHTSTVICELERRNSSLANK